MTRIIHAGIVQPFIRLAVVGLRVTDGQKQFDAAPPPPLPGILQRCRMKRRRVHAEVLERLGLVPLLALGMRLGEASGAGMAMGLLKGALACHTGMATFAQAGVSEKGAG